MKTQDWKRTYKVTLRMKRWLQTYKEVQKTYSPTFRLNESSGQDDEEAEETEETEEALKDRRRPMRGE
jgi:hypothetical protein